MNQNKIQILSFSGQHQECLQACQQLIQSEPDNPLPWKYAGKSLFALEQLDEARQCFLKSHHLSANDPETARDIGNVFFKLGRINAAAQWYEKSLKIDSNYAYASNNLAALKRQSGKHEEAVDLYKRAIQADSELIEAYAGAAQSLITLKDFDRAESFAKQAIKLNKDLPGINEILGVIYQNKKKFQKAVASYKKELTIDPRSYTSLLNLGLLLLQQGKAEEAILPLTQAAEFNPSDQCSLLLAQAYQSIGKPKEAISEYEKIVCGKTQDKMIPFNLGLCLLETGNNIDAIKAFNLAITIDESFLEAWGNVGTALMNEGKHHEALPVTQKVLDRDPNNPTAHMNLGEIYKNLGNFDQALASTLKSLELKPDNPTALMNLGMTYETLNELDRALESYTKSARLIDQNNSGSSLTSLICASVILLQMNRIGDAKKALSSALAIAHNKEIKLNQYSTKNKKHDDAYLSYLSKLIPEIPIIIPKIDSQILHLGESHCLAFTNQTIGFKGERYTIKPSLIKGAKAFHLSEELKINLQKAGFEKRLQENLDNYKRIFLSFGEIDCREDEGILLYCRESGKAIQDVSQTTATKYFKWTANALAKHKDKLVYFGTPAPFRIDPRRGGSSQNSNQRLLAIKIFNATLAAQCKESGAIFANVYELTADRDGYNNDKWMIDEFHLNPIALNELFKSL